MDSTAEALTLERIVEMAAAVSDLLLAIRPAESFSDLESKTKRNLIRTLKAGIEYQTADPDEQNLVWAMVRAKLKFPGLPIPHESGQFPQKVS